MAVRDDFAPGEVLAAADLNDTFASKLDLAGGKILQIVRATDSTDRTTTSTTYVDANLSVTITPQKSDSAVLLLAIANAGITDGSYVNIQITDNSNNAISSGEDMQIGSGAAGAVRATYVQMARATPATTSAVTYKLRFRRNAFISGTAALLNSQTTGQLYAIEVSA